MHKRTAISAIVTIAALAAFAIFVGWATGRMDLGWAGLRSAWPYLLAGIVTVAVVIAGFVRLAFFSDRHGFDDRAGGEGG
jgi:hypothetical protein